MKKPTKVDVLEFKAKQTMSKAPRIVSAFVTHTMLIRSAIFYILDIVKDAIFLDVLYEDLTLVKNYENIPWNIVPNSANSKAERYLWSSAVISILFAQLLISVQCYLNRYNIFPINLASKKKKIMFDIFLLVLFPLLPLFLILSMARLKKKQQALTSKFLRKEVRMQDYLLKKQQLDER